MALRCKIHFWSVGGRGQRPIAEELEAARAMVQLWRDGVYQREFGEVRQIARARTKLEQIKPGSQSRAHLRNT